MNKEGISILMPVKNVEKYIKQCIDSVLNQTHNNFELVIINDSNDDTVNIINQYTDSRINHIIFRGNISEKLNYAIKIAQYEYICRMDGDDIIDSKKFEKQIRFLNQNPEVDILGTNYFCIDESGSLLYEKILPQFHKDIEFMMPVITSVLHSSVMLKKSTFQKIAPYNETLNYAEDLDIFLRALKKICFYNLQESLYYYRLYNKKPDMEKEKISYLLSLKYINETLDSSKDNPETIYKLGLLEYYKNDIGKARKIFIKLIFNNKNNKFRIIRYLLPALLGGTLIKLLRKSGLLYKINSYSLKLFKYDTNSIKLK